MRKETILGIIISAIITLGVSYLFFGLANKQMKPVYAFIKSPSLIYDNNNSSPRIKVVVEDSLQVTENVYVTTLAFWNKGNEEIQLDDVRRPVLVFCSDTKGQIIDYEIVKQSDPELSNFRITQIEDSLKIDWDYFDPKGGCLLQVIYSGQDNTEIIMNGRIGTKTLIKVTPKDLNHDWRVSLFLVLLIVFMAGATMIFYFIPGSAYYKDKRTWFVFGIPVLITFLLWLLSFTNIIFKGVPFL